MAHGAVSNADFNGSPRSVYRQIEEWWGNSFSHNLIDIIATAPREQLLVAADSLAGPLVDKTKLKKRGAPLRPIVSTPIEVTLPLAARARQEFALALKLLLYCDDVVMSDGYLDPFEAFRERPGFELPPPGLEGEATARKELRQKLALMLDMRALVEQELIVFGRFLWPPDWAMADFKQVFERNRDQWVRDGLMRRPPDRARVGKIYALDMSEKNDDFWLGLSVGQAMGFAIDHPGMPLGTTRLERAIWHELLGNKMYGHQVAKLETLASIRVPDLTGRVSALVAVRNSSRSFAEWRSALGNGLSEINQLGEDPSELIACTRHLGGELRTQLAAIGEEIDRSPALTSLKGGLWSFGVAGLGAAASFAAFQQQPWAALTGAATVKAADTAVNYVKARREFRENMAVWDLVLSFEPQ